MRARWDGVGVYFTLVMCVRCDYVVRVLQDGCVSVSVTVSLYVFQYLCVTVCVSVC